MPRRPLVVYFYVFVISCIICRSTAEEIELGPINGKQFNVSGYIYYSTTDGSVVLLKWFTYNGKGTDAFFWVGTSGNSPQPGRDTSVLVYPNKEGKWYEYDDDDAPILGEIANENLTLPLPSGVTISDLRWFSVWCRQYNIDFGSFKFPDKLPGGIPDPEESVEATDPEKSGEDSDSEDSNEPNEEEEEDYDPQPEIEEWKNASTFKTQPFMLLVMTVSIVLMLK